MTNRNYKKPVIIKEDLEGALNTLTEQKRKEEEKQRAQVMKLVEKMNSKEGLKEPEIFEILLGDMDDSEVLNMFQESLEEEIEEARGLKKVFGKILLKTIKFIHKLNK